MATTKSLEGTKCLTLITGASRGFGRCCAQALAEIVGEGSTFVLTARSKNGLEETKAKLEPKVKVLLSDLDGYQPKTEDFKQLFSQVNPSNYETAVIVHNAGSLGEHGTLNKDLKNLDELTKYFTLNLFSVSMLNSIFLEKVKEIERQYVINVSSLAAVMPIKSWSLYCSGKAARDMFFKVLAKEEESLRYLFSY